MNRWGVDGCREKIDELAAQVVDNARKQGVEMPHPVAKMAIDEACRLAEINAPQTTENQDA